MSSKISSLPELVSARASELGSKVAFIDDAAQISYEEIHEKVELLASNLIHQGLTKGDRVAIWSPNSINWILVATAIQAAGGILVPINTRMKGSEAGFILNKSKAKFLFTENNFLDINYLDLLKDQDLPNLNKTFVLNPNHSETEASINDLFSKQSINLPKIVQDDVADIIFTSGTTGEPKGVMINQSQNINVFDYWSTFVGLNSEDRYLIVNPFFHTFGYKAGWMSVFLRGCTGYPEAVFDVEKIVSKISKHKITMLPGPPTLYQSILSSNEFDSSKVSSLRLGVTGAAAIPVSLIKDMKEKLGFETVITAYGLTESTGVATMCTPNDDYETIATTSGKSIEGVEVKCVDGDGKEVTSGEQGEILVKGFNVMQGYLDNPEATEEAIDKEGWLHTGDIGIIDDKGYLKITDRLKDMFIVGGFNAYPAEIENILLNHPSIIQAAVVGIPDERMGEVPKAFLVMNGKDLSSKEEIIKWAKDNMANYKVPREIEFLDSLPVNAAGKIMKFKLR